MVFIGHFDKIQTKMMIYINYVLFVSHLMHQAFMAIFLYIEIFVTI